ncbi:MAG: NAD(P)/FAD-dependent oxidoreductase, partial [Lentilitoribacter sp.]
MTDLLIIGAGPAGMRAAITASSNGADVTVVDNRTEPGGNIYAFHRSTRTLRPTIWNALGSTYHAGTQLVEQFLSANIKYLPRNALWHLDPDGTASVKGPNGIKTFAPQKVILATGALERPMPMENWTLPGVMGVGAAQILLKSGGELPKGPIIIVGNGPLPLLYASQIMNMGGKIDAFIIPKIPRSMLTTVKDLSGSLSGAWHGKHYLIKGMAYLLKRITANVPVYRNASNFQILGDEYVKTIRFKTNRTHELAAETVLVHDGVIPNINPAAAAGLELKRSDQQDCWFAKSNDTISIAGDVGGILGAKAAQISGEIAALTAMDLPVSQNLKTALIKEQKFRQFIDHLYPSIGSANLANDQTLICRCEAVSKQTMISSITNTGSDPNRLKTYLRCGMGPCQGRICSPSIETIISSETGEKKQNIG